MSYGKDRLPEGYKVRSSDGTTTLEILKYSEQSVEAFCSGCGYITPFLNDYTEAGFTDWLDHHIDLFSKYHKKEQSN